MRKPLTTVAVAVLILLLGAPVAEAQSSQRTTIRDGDVWTLDTADFGGFVEWIISWTKKVDFDITVRGSADGGATFFTTCAGQSTQDGFERCHFGQGQTKYAATITRFGSGSKSAKGAIWISLTDEDVTQNRTGAAPKLAYRGNIYDETDDPLLLYLRDEVASHPVTKVPIER